MEKMNRLVEMDGKSIKNLNDPSDMRVYAVMGRSLGLKDHKPAVVRQLDYRRKKSSPIGGEIKMLSIPATQNGLKGLL